MKNGLKVIVDEKYLFASSFDTRSGFYYRTNVKNLTGIDTGIDPFMASFPQLLDIGIMGSCAHGLSGKCKSSGVQCYQNGWSYAQENMSFDHYKKIIQQCKYKVFQVALGGRGDPDQHPSFGEILAYTRQFQIVPNYTTSGFGLKKKHARLSKAYCGAVAVSWYRNPYTLKAIQLLLDEGVKTNIHYVLSRESLDEAITLLEADRFPNGLNRIIFLLHKPIGLGKKENILSCNDPKVAYFFSLFNLPEICNKAGFDSCSVPGILNMAKNISPLSIDTCEGGRYSGYITPDMKFLPCSFYNHKNLGIDLNKVSIEAAWNSPLFEAFRMHFKKACPKCDKRTLCYGGCPISKAIVLCKDLKGGEHFEN